MSGYPGDLSPKQQAAYEQFKTRVKDIIQPSFDDYYLTKWLRARSWDVPKAEKMLRDSLEWRRKFDTDNILSWTPPEVLSKYYPGGVCGFDKEGNPMWIDTLGTIDLKGLFMSVKKIDVLRYKIYWMEKIYVMMDEQSEKLNKHVDKSGMIFDMDGIGMKHLWKPGIDLFTEILATFEANYPETLSTCYVINAPSFFPIAYNLVKPFLSEDTRKKIVILGSNWRAKLLDYISADQLPKNWGGSCTDPDGNAYCTSKVCMGGKIPEHYYIAKLNNVDLSNFITTIVGRRSSIKIDTEVKEAGSILRWQFWTEMNDIGFGVFRRTAEGHQKKAEMEEIVPTERVNSHFVPEDGSIKCDLAGIYVLRFDNTYSWITGKNLSYQIEVLKPDTSLDLVTRM